MVEETTANVLEHPALSVKYNLLFFVWLTHTPDAGDNKMLVVMLFTGRVKDEVGSGATRGIKTASVAGRLKEGSRDTVGPSSPRNELNC